MGLNGAVRLRSRMGYIAPVDRQPLAAPRWESLGTHRAPETSVTPPEVPARWAGLAFAAARDNNPGLSEPVLPGGIHDGRHYPTHRQRSFRRVVVRPPSGGCHGGYWRPRRLGGAVDDSRPRRRNRRG